MSAWIVTSAHIDALVQGGIQFGLVSPDHDRHELGRMLWLVNHDSVNYRYGEAAVPPAYRFVPAEFTLEPWALLKQVNCYHYQSCEQPGWENSDAATFCARLAKGILKSLGIISKGDDSWRNPLYGAAPWGISSLPEIAATAGAALADDGAHQ